jgi:hypothetical protein
VLGELIFRADLRHSYRRKRNAKYRCSPSLSAIATTIGMFSIKDIEFTAAVNVMRCASSLPCSHDMAGYLY